MKNSTNHSNGETLLDDLQALHNVSVPALRMPAVPASLSARRTVMRWRPAAFTAAAIAGLALFAGGLAPFGGGPADVSAETILQKTAGVANSNALASGTVSYHLVSRNESFWPGAERATVDTENEVWYLDESHQRSESRELGKGDVLHGTSQSGNDLWIYASVDGKTRAVHGNADVLGFRTGGVNEFGADNLSELLALYSGGGCSSATLVDEEEVVGRDTYVIEVKPTWETCPFKVSGDPAAGDSLAGPSKTDSVKIEPAIVAGAEVNPVNAAGAGEPASSKASLVVAGKNDMTTKMWVDAETFITLKTESYSGRGLVFRYEVTEFETGIDIPDRVFEYDPPAGVQVVEATSPIEMKIALSDLFTSSGEPTSAPAGGAVPLAP